MRPSAIQMGHLRRLVESRRFTSQRPDASLLAFEQVQPWEMCLALRGDGFSLVYTPTGRQIRIAIGKLGMARVRASWFNPRDGRTGVQLYRRLNRPMLPPPLLADCCAFLRRVNV